MSDYPAKRPVWALLPVKAFAQAKSRLKGELEVRYGVDTDRLACSMLQDVLRALSNSKTIDRVVIVTAEQHIQLPDCRQSITIIDEPRQDLSSAKESERKLNQALEAGLQHLRDQGAECCLILPSDIPLVTADELDAAIKAHRQQRAKSPANILAIQSSHDGSGTSLLCLDPRQSFTPAFGEQSFQAHIAQAERRAYKTITLDLPMAARDMDTIEDIHQLNLDSSIFGKDIAPHTQRLFAERQSLSAKGSTKEQVIAFVNAMSLSELMTKAAYLRDQHGFRYISPQQISYSKKAFIPLTRLCRDVCHYCTFATTPKKLVSPFLSPEQVLETAREGQRQGCKEALLTLGEKPELRYRVAREALEAMGFSSTLEYVANIASLIIQETGLLPHINAGCMTADEIAMLRPVSASMGIMLENVSPRLCEKGQPHYGSPDKQPRARLDTLINLGKASVPTTTGILIGIGETREERIDSLLAIRDLHQQYGHIQEIIIQNFVAKQQTKMAGADNPAFDELLWTIAVARMIFGAQMSIQVPPNLNAGRLEQLVAAGINDWGGVSPVTPDHVNPESPWPELEQLAVQTRSVGKTLVERLTIYPAYLRQSQRWLDKAINPAVLKLADGAGLAREDAWLSGTSKELPLAFRKDATFNRIPQISKPVRAALQRLMHAGADQAISKADIASLFDARGDDFEAVCQAANRLRRQVNGDVVSYVVNRNINYTNICTYSCSFCAFSKGNKKGNSIASDRPYLKAVDEIVALATEAVEQGATEVCLQGGIHPQFTGQTYLDICQAIHDSLPDLHIHAFSPLEVWHGAETLGLSVSEKCVSDFLLQLKQAGLKSLPGTAAEILHNEVRNQICADKLTTQQWLQVIEAAHEVGLPTTATIMFGHVDRYEHWAEHLLQVRSLQQQTGGFTEFVPLSFVADEAPVYKRGRSRRGPTLRESVLMHAVARIVFHGLIDNIQTSWVKMGLEGAKLCLQSGASDLGGVLMNESITRAAGAQHGQQMSAQTLREAVESIKRQPQQRTTLYGQCLEQAALNSGLDYSVLDHSVLGHSVLDYEDMAPMFALS